MELGEKLRQARQAAGLSQRQLCGQTITRNMLSQIEHGTARPSMDTLRYLAGRLDRPVSFFLDEEAALSPNQDLMTRARGQYEAGDLRQAWLLLQSFRRPDPVLEWQWQYLSGVTALALARQALEEGKHRYARQILEEAAVWTGAIPELERQRLLQLGPVSGVSLPEVVRQLPSLDEELLLRAEAAMEEAHFARADRLLLAAEDQQSFRWHLLRGRSLLEQQQYTKAAHQLEQAEPGFPERCWPLLERCFRELGDFEKAYLYACRQR